MRPVTSSMPVPIDVEQGGVLLANMLVAWLDDDLKTLPAGESVDESQDRRTSPEQASLRLPASVDAEPSPPPSGKHGTPVCTPPEGAGTGLERILDPHAGSGPGEDRYRNDGTGGLQDLGDGGLDGASGCRVCVGGLTTGALESGLASAPGVVRTYRNAGDRRRWLLRSGGFQRRIVAGIEGCDGPGRATFFARAPPGRKAQQSEERGVAFSRSGWLMLRRARPHQPGPRRRSAQRRGVSVSALPGDGQRLWGDATIRGKRLTFSQAILRRRLGWQDHMGSADAQSCVEHAQESLLCGDVCLWPLSIS